MKNLFLTAFAVIICLLMFSSCKKLGASFASMMKKAEAQTQGGAPGSPGEGSALYSQPIPVDSANRMIQSYLTSIGYPEENMEIRSWAFDADTLRNYLNSEEGQHIKHIKFFMAHTLGYINSGHYGERPDKMYADDFTVIIAGLDSTGNYVLNKLDMPYDQSLPCPYRCVGENLIHNDE